MNKSFTGQHSPETEEEASEVSLNPAKKTHQNTTKKINLKMKTNSFHKPKKKKTWLRKSQ